MTSAAEYAAVAGHGFSSTQGKIIMDKSWISYKRNTQEFRKGVEDFIQFAVTHQKQGEQFSCPCKRCGNMGKVSTIVELQNHIFVNGFSKGYTEWIWHGEGSMNNPTNDYGDHVETFCDNLSFENDQLDEMLCQMEDGERSLAFDCILNDAEKPLYSDCTNYTRLSSVLKLFKLKAQHGMTDKNFMDILMAFNDMLPEGNVLPTSTYQAKKMLCPMALDAEKIHACPNDCVLYRNEYKDLHEFPKCGTSRYKVSKDAYDDKDGPPKKVLWYLPVVPRIKRLFGNAKDAKNMTWHANSNKKDEMLRHVEDSPQWKCIDDKYPDFGKEARNLRLGLCTDGVNPFGNMSSQHSTWPVLMVIYNLPPWLCMKRKYIMMSLLISGPRQPGNDIDVYLAPLIEDLKMLWDDGVAVFDAHRQQPFTLRAMIYCTINDFPAYGDLSGHTVQGYKACSICEDETKATRLPKSNKLAYIHNRRFLPRTHPYRRLRKAFDGTPQHESAHIPLIGEQVYERVKDISCVFGKPYKGSDDQLYYKKKSIFWTLPYWKHLLVRHCLDVMHVEKNVFDSLISTLLNMAGKTKDGRKARGDMVKLGIRQD